MTIGCGNKYEDRSGVPSASTLGMNEMLHHPKLQIDELLCAFHGYRRCATPLPWMVVHINTTSMTAAEVESVRLFPPCRAWIESMENAHPLY